MFSRRLLWASAVGLFLSALTPGRSVAAAPDVAPSGTPSPKVATAGAQTNTPPATKAATKKETPGTPAAPIAPTAKTLGKNDTSGKGEAAPSGKIVKAADEPDAADVDEPAGATKTPRSAKPKAKATARKKPAVPTVQTSRVGEGPSPAMPPPLTIGGLRDEVRRENGPVTIDPSAPARTKVEQMLAEITKTREALRDATSRLEGLMGDGAEPIATSAPAGSAPGPAVAAAAGKPAAKNPLDVLAKALRGIKPEQAAPIVARLDKRLAATVLLRMPPVDAGKIMGALKPDTAAELATQISMRVTPGEVKR